MSHIKQIFLLFFICGNFYSYGQVVAIWKKSTFHQRNVVHRQIIPDLYDVYQLDFKSLCQKLVRTPLRSNAGNFSKPIISIPNTHNELCKFEIVETPILAPKLAAQYPEIHSYLGVDINDPSQTIRFDISPNGFHGMILKTGQNPVFIDPYAKEKTGYYIVYNKNDTKESEHFICLSDNLQEKRNVQKSNLRAGDCDLRTYRLALSCTGEYAQYHGGTKASVLAAMNTTMTRVNGIYERDLAIKMEIIDNNDEIIFLDANTDPFTNNSATKLINENQNTIDSIIGASNYDIGHSFSTGAGGLAAIACVCGSTKAKGVTGSPNPVGDAFDIDYVCHEMGHQFGALHTFNNSCLSNRANSSSYEPGSGSTIMGYAGICPPNIQTHSDAYFHSHSIIQIENRISLTNCPIKTTTGNHQPVLNNLSDYTIPNSTPFELTASATDIDNDPLTYCWEQIDKEIANMPPEPTSTGGPVFRSFAPSSSNTRSFPKLSKILTNTTSTWEVLPEVARTLHFRCMVRDNHPGAGCTSEDEMVVTVANNTQPFKITSPNTPVSWNGLDTKNISWDVANTNQAPVNATSVDILLSTDGGLTFPITLASEEVNDGNAMVTFPNMISSTQCRIKIKASNNIFFDINDANFTLEPAVISTFFINASPDSKSVCTTMNSSTNFDLNFTTELGFNESINLTLSGLPSGVTYNFSANDFTPPSDVSLTINNLNQPGNYDLVVSANATSVQKSINLNLEVLASFLAQPSSITPENGASNISGSIILSWNAIANAKSYNIELSTNPSFPSGNTTSITENTTSHQLNSLAPSTAYYWKVRADNGCVQGDFSELRSFQTGGLNCTTYNSADIPKNIPSAVTTTSTLSITDDYPIYDLNVSMDISHSWVGDLSGALKGPDDTEILLFDRPGIPSTSNGCGQNNLNVTFDDEANQTASQFESTCTSNADYAIQGSFQPNQDALSDFDNKMTQGDWTLSITDPIAPDEGTINNWNVEVCYLYPAITSILLIKNTVLTAINNQSTQILENNLKTISAGVPVVNMTYTLVESPILGVLKINDTALTVGSQFTQADIDLGKVSYLNTASGTTDLFKFDVKDNSTGWIGNQIFNINLITNTLDVSATITSQILCNADENGSISIQATGGTAPFQYSLDGSTFQSSNVFSGLGAGNFQITVKDANNLMATTSISLTEPSLLVLNTTLNQNNVTINASGGTSPYSYSIDNQNYQLSNMFSLPNGQTTVFVKDANNCIQSKTVSVSINNLILNYTTSPITCFNGSDGQITATASSGTPPYNFSIDNGTNYQSSGVFSNLSAGTYSISVKDANNFVQQEDNIVLTNPSLIAIDVMINGNNISINPTGNYTYALDNGNFQTSNSFSNLTNGTHIAYIKDNLGCQNEQSFNILLNTLDLSFTKKDILCYGDHTGEIIASATGNGTIMYALNDGVFQSSNIFSNLEAGQYILKAKDAQGLTKDINVTITSPNQIIVSAQVTDHTVNISVTGGVSPYAYSIDGIAAFQNNPTFENVPSGTQTIHVKDSNGCEKEQQIQIVDNISATTSTKNITCNGGTDGAITISPTGGLPPYTYSINNITFVSENVFSDLNAGSYHIIVKDANNESYSIDVTLTEPDPIDLTISSIYDKIVIENTNNQFTEFSLDQENWQTSNEFPAQNVGNYIIYAKLGNGCIITKAYFHDYQLLGGNANQIISCESFKGIEITAIGGLPPYQYSLNGEEWQDSKTFLNIESSGKVNFYIKDALEHKFHGQLNLKIVALLTLDVNQMDDSIEMIVTGGTPPYEYSIDGENWQTSNLFMNLTSANYTAIVRDQDGCTQTHAFTIVATENLQKINNIKISPNPNSGHFILSISDKTNKEISVSIYNIIGQNIFEKHYSKEDNNLEVPIHLNQGSGIFQILITDGEKWDILRVIVE